MFRYLQEFQKNSLLNDLNNIRVHNINTESGAKLLPLLANANAQRIQIKNTASLEILKKDHSETVLAPAKLLDI